MYRKRIFDKMLIFFKWLSQRNFGKQGSNKNRGIWEVCQSTRRRRNVVNEKFPLSHSVTLLDLFSRFGLTRSFDFSSSSCADSLWTSKILQAFHNRCDNLRDKSEGSAQHPGIFGIFGTNSTRSKWRSLIFPKVWIFPRLWWRLSLFVTTCFISTDCVR